MADKILLGFSCIVDDGHCTDHGFFLPPPEERQSMGVRGVIRPVVEFVEVPTEELRGVLNRLSAAHHRRLQEAGLLQ